MRGLYQIVYTSTATEPFGKTELVKLLEESVWRNTRAGITGALLYYDGTFLQVLEGEEQAVKDLYARISRDPRHHHLIPLIQERIARRDFPDAAMAFQDLQSPELRILPGDSEYLNGRWNDEPVAADAPRSKQLLLRFQLRVL